MRCEYKESLNSPNSDKLKLKTIFKINSAGLEVKKIIINSNLTESEAFAAEAVLINVFNYNSLIVAVYKPTQWYKCKEALENAQDKVLT